MDMAMRVCEARPPMLSTIAVGTDGSATASKAVEVAAEMAQKFDAKLILLSAAHDSKAPVTASGP